MRFNYPQEHQYILIFKELTTGEFKDGTTSNNIKFTHWTDAFGLDEDQVQQEAYPLMRMDKNLFDRFVEETVIPR